MAVFLPIGGLFGVGRFGVKKGVPEGGVSGGQLLGGVWSPLSSNRVQVLTSSRLTSSFIAFSFVLSDSYLGFWVLMALFGCFGVIALLVLIGVLLLVV